MNDLSKVLESAIASQGSAELAVIYLMGKYDCDLNELKARIEDKALNVSFSKVKYKNIVHFVGLNPVRQFLDAPKFDINCARILSDLFKEIVEEIQSNMQEYGPPSEHKNEEASRAIWHFKLLIKNTLESIIPGHMMTKGQIEHHYKLFRGITIIFVEVKVIAESDACDYSNACLGFNSFPIYGFLSDRTLFEFFWFDGSTKPPTFTQGVCKAKMNQGICSFNTLTIPPLEGIDSSKFILSLWPAAEFIFWAEKKPHESTPGWIDCLQLAKEVLQLTVNANSKAASVPKSHQHQEWNIMPAWYNEQMSNSW
ncbi:hypothetical protein L208DRAFT_1422392 [Tricholoma matsutake]|nr:hypothetical protein L208DRAFT_1422392 [Tricholoma matsutake 945]